MQKFIVAYDVFNPKRLVKIKKVVYSYAIGGQKSALETLLNKNLMNELVEQLELSLKEEDKLNIIRILDTPILLGRASTISYENNGVIIL